MNFITKALGKHAIYSHEVFGQTASELLDFANSVATPKSYETSSGWVLNNFPANLEQAQTYEDMTDGLNLVVTTAGNNSEVANYFRSRGQLMEFEYDSTETEGFICSVESALEQHVRHQIRHSLCKNDGGG